MNLYQSAQHQTILQDKTKYLLTTPDSGTFIKCDKPVLKLMSFLKNIKTEDQIISYFGNELIKSKLLDKLYENGIVSKNGERKLKTPTYAPDILTAVILLTRACNLRCKYCYVQDKDTAQKMSSETLEQTIKILKASKLNKKIALEFHGGEPLLAINMIKRAIELTKDDPKFKYLIQTNATLITPEIAKLIKENNIGIGISIDGPPALHDQIRVLNNSGAGSSHLVKKGIENLKKADVHFGLIGVISQKNIHAPKEIFEYFTKLGVNGFRVNPVIYCGQPFDVGIKPEQFKKFMVQLLKIQLEYNAKKTPEKRVFVKNFSSLTNNLTTNARKFMCARPKCGAGESILSIYPNGSLNACSMELKEDYGNVNDIENIDEFILNYNNPRSTLTNKGCKECNFKMICDGGGCLDELTSIGAPINQAGSLCNYNKIMFTKLLHILFFEQEKIELILSEKRLKHFRRSTWKGN